MGAIVSVVFSFRNEEDVIPTLIERTLAAFDDQAEDVELIFVDDDSTDGSAALLAAAHKKDERIKVVTMSRRFGVSECVIAGMHHASGDAVVYMDADMQDPPEVIPQLLMEWRAGADVVHTVRDSRAGEGWLKLTLTRVAYHIIRFASEIEMPIEAGDFKLLSRRAVDELLQLPEHDLYMRGLVVWIGFKQVQVRYERDARLAGETKFPLFSRNPAKTLVSAITSFSFFPIYAMALAAGIGLVVASILGAYGLIALIAGWFATDPLWIAFILVLWSTLLLAIATLGVYVLRSYKDARGRPRYIVAQRLGVDAPTNELRS